MPPNSRLAAVGIAALAACATHAPVVPGRQLPLADVRRPIVGAWVLEFRVDSVAGPPRGDRVGYVAGSGVTVRGRLEVQDAVIPSDVPAYRDGLLQADVVVDFTPGLGRQVGCFDPGPGSIYVEVQTRIHRFTIGFTPDAPDCGLWALGVYYGDSLIGTWSELSRAGNQSHGRFRMIRRPWAMLGCLTRPCSGRALLPG